MVNDLKYEQLLNWHDSNVEQQCVRVARTWLQEQITALKDWKFVAAW
jgi:hypothetical protein